MKRTFLTPLLLTAAVAGALGLGELARTSRTDRHEAPASAEPAAPSRRPRIDVVFALDTTGSMGGLLEGAKKKIWAIADRIVSGQPRPDVRIGLVAYRDRDDAYVTRVTPLTRDMDGVHQALLSLRPAGGGDGPEHVNAALGAAIDGQMGWAEGQGVLRLVFLVGDAPPHDDYDGPKSWELASTARARGITINTLRCGTSARTEAAWRRIASAAGGDFESIAQDGGVIVRETPYDGELAALNRELAETVIAYGSESARRRSRAKMAARSGLGGALAASAAAYNAKSRRMNDEDLLTQLESGAAKLDALEVAALPARLRDLAPEAREQAILDARARRAEVNAKILEVSEKREAFLRAAKKRDTQTSELDDGLMRALREQAKVIDVAY